MALLRLTVKNIVDKKFRFLLTSFAVFLGVMFTVGVFVFTDSLRSTFGDLSQDIGFVDVLAVGEEDFEQSHFQIVLTRELALPVTSRYGLKRQFAELIGEPMQSFGEHDMKGIVGPQAVFGLHPE